MKSKGVFVFLYGKERNLCAVIKTRESRDNFLRDNGYIIPLEDNGVMIKWVKNLNTIDDYYEVYKCEVE